MIIELILAFLLGALVQRIYSARHGGFTKLGASWKLSNNWLYLKLHSFYCECCPRRHYCEMYKEKIKNEM